MTECQRLATSINHSLLSLTPTDDFPCRAYSLGKSGRRLMSHRYKRTDVKHEYNKIIVGSIFLINILFFLCMTCSITLHPKYLYACFWLSNLHFRLFKKLYEATSQKYCCTTIQKVHSAKLMSLSSVTAVGSIIVMYNMVYSIHWHYGNDILHLSKLRVISS